MRRGFTILELTLVLAVMLVVAAITVPSLEVMQGDTKLNAAADIVRGRWADARGRALEDGVAYRFAVIPQTGKFRVAPDSDDFWSGGGGDAPQSDNAPLVLEDSLPEGVVFADASDSGSGGGEGGDWQPVVAFLPDGTAARNVEVAFKARGTRTLTLRLRGLTGAVTRQRDGGR